MNTPTTPLTDSSALTIAVDYLGAEHDVETDTYTYTDDATGDTYRSDSWDLVGLGKRLMKGEDDAYSRWCADTHAERVA